MINWGNEYRKPLCLDVLLGACIVTDVHMRDVCGRSRRSRLVLTRQLYVYVARKVTIASYPEIARGLRRMSHSACHDAAALIGMQIASGQSRFIGDVEHKVSELVDRVADATVRVQCARMSREEVQGV